MEQIFIGVHAAVKGDSLEIYPSRTTNTVMEHVRNWFGQLSSSPFETLLGVHAAVEGDSLEIYPGRPPRIGSSRPRVTRPYTGLTLPSLTCKSYNFEDYSNNSL